MRAMKIFTAPPHPIVAARKRINQDPAMALEMFELLKEQQARLGFTPTVKEVADALYWCKVRNWTVQQYGQLAQ